MLLTSTDGAGVELRPIGYETSVAPPVPEGAEGAEGAEGWDANWLQVEGAVRTASGESWTFHDPCLTTWEARDLGAWLEDAARGEVPVTAAPDRDPVGVIEFTEPELAFSVAARDGEHLVLRVHLAHLATAARPPATTPQEAPDASGVLTLPMRTTRQALLDAAAAWRDELVPFPDREADPRG